MLQGHASISQDSPPYVTAAGLNNIVGLNSIGLRRGGFNPAIRKEIKRAYQLFYHQELNRQQALEIAAKETWGEKAQNFINFLSKKSKLGYCMRTRWPVSCLIFERCPSGKTTVFSGFLLSLLLKSLILVSRPYLIGPKILQFLIITISTSLRNHMKSAITWSHYFSSTKRNENHTT